MLILIQCRHSYRVQNVLFFDSTFHYFVVSFSLAKKISADLCVNYASTGLETDDMTVEALAVSVE